MPKGWKWSGSGKGTINKKWRVMVKDS